jgi:hypothetical protein
MSRGVWKDWGQLIGVRESAKVTTHRPPIFPIALRVAASPILTSAHAVTSTALVWIFVRHKFETAALLSIAAYLKGSWDTGSIALTVSFYLIAFF